MIGERDTGPDDLGSALVIYLVEGKKTSKYVEEVVNRVVESGETVFMVMGDERRCFTNPESEYAKKAAKLMAEGRTPSDG